MTNKQKLLKHFYEIYGDYAFKTSDVMKWGAENYSNRASRDARQLAENGFLRRISDDKEKEKYGHFGKESSYVITLAGQEYLKELGQKTFF